MDTGEKINKLNGKRLRFQALLCLQSAVWAEVRARSGDHVVDAVTELTLFDQLTTLLLKTLQT